MALRHDPYKKQGCLFMLRTANLTFPSISPIILSLWKGVRVVEGGGLENR